MYIEAVLCAVIFLSLRSSGKPIFVIYFCSCCPNRFSVAHNRADWKSWLCTVVLDRIVIVCFCPELELGDTRASAVPFYCRDQKALSKLSVCSL